MQEPIQEGSILFQEGTLFPESLQLESESFSPGWRSVKGLDGFALERKTHDAGWTFFYMAGECRATAIGSEGQKAARNAIRSILAGLKSEGFNSLEITRIAFKHWLGVPYADVSFHKRNMQEGAFLLARGGSPAWETDRLVAS
jgi:hypothetical protein